MYGYAGKVLQVDLAKEKTVVESLNEVEIKKYIGGMGYAVKLLYDNLAPNIDPLNEENVVVIATGPACGTIAPTGDGFAVVSKSPLTMGLGVSMSSGKFAQNLKMAGYDALIIKGKSKKPTTLVVDDDIITFLDARELWGKSPARTDEKIKKDLGDDSFSVAAIGRAGENLARIACVLHDRTRIAGRTGIGAVMGSKLLKAVAVRGTKGVHVSNPDELISFCREFYLKARGSDATRFYNKGTTESMSVKDRVWTMLFESTSKYRNVGTTKDILTFNRLGCLPTRNFSSGSFEGATQISGEYFNEHYLLGISSCSSCSIGCEHIAMVREGAYKDSVALLDYGAIWAFGPNCGVNQADAIIKAIEICNLYGIDPISTGNLVGFSMDCYERGILTYDNTSGLELKFGNEKAMLELVRRIGTRDGLGNLLADGVRIAAQRIGNEAGALANHIKGLEMTGYDLRCLKTAALGFAVSFKGADHNTHWAHAFDVSGRVNRFIVEKGRGKLVMDMEDFLAILDSLVICKFLLNIYEDFDQLAKLYNILCGYNLTSEELKLAGERTTNLARLFNNREGLTRSDDSLPVKVMTVPLPNGLSAGSIVSQEDLNFLLDDYYCSRGWTKEAIPTKAKLEQLGLS